MKHKDMEVPGNILASAALTDRILTKVGLAVHMSQHTMERMSEEGMVVIRITFKAGSGVHADWLAIIAVKTEGGGIVAFHSAPSFPATVEGLCHRVNNGSLKWKEDQYAE